MISMTWLVLRTTGIVALAMLTVAAVIGIMSPALRRPTGRLTAISVHSAAAATGVILLLGHIVLAIADAYVEVPPAAAVVPGMSVWEPLWVGVGTVAFDLFLLVMITSLTRLRAPVLWRRVHFASYGALLLAWTHALMVGTDGGSRAFQVAACVSLAAVGLAIVVRQSRPARRPTTVPERPLVGVRS